jgi:hypothetical protein
MCNSLLTVEKMREVSSKAKREIIAALANESKTDPYFIMLMSKAQAVASKGGTTVFFNSEDDYQAAKKYYKYLEELGFRVVFDFRPVCFISWE